MERTTPAPRLGGRRALVTGASGFIGRRLVAELRARGAKVCCLVRRPDAESAFAAEGIDTVRGDLARPETLRGLPAFDLVFHLAGVLAARRREEFERVNVDGCRHLYEALASSSSPPERIVHVSSIAAGGPSPGREPRREEETPAPVSLYGRTKLAGEEVARQEAERLSITILRPAVVYGPADRNLLPIFRMAARGLVLTPPRQPKLYSMVHVDDLARAIVLAAGSEALVGGTYHVACGEPCSWRTLIAEVGDAVGRRPRSLALGRLPYLLAAWLHAAESRLPGRRRVDLLIPQKLPELFARFWHVDARRLWSEIDLEPLPLAEGLRETAAWYRTHGWL